MHPTATGRYLFSLLMAMFLLMGASTAQAQVVVNENGDFEQSEVGQTSDVLNWALWFAGGGATAEVVEDPDDAANKVLRVELVDTSLAATAWDFQVVHYGGNDLALEEGHEYQVSVRVRAENPDEGVVSLALNDGGAAVWGQPISGTGWTTLTSGVFTAGEDDAQSFGVHLSADANPDGQVFYIDDMVVVDLTAEPEPDPDPEDPLPDPSDGTELIVNGDFEDGLSQWSTHRGAILQVVTEDVYEGTNSVRVTNRGETGSGPLQYLTGQVRQGEQYYFSAWVKYDEGPEEKLFQMAMQNGPSWQGIEIMGGVTAPRGEWAQIEGVYTVPDTADLSQTFIFLETVWVENPTAADDLMDFYVDAVSVVDLGTQLAGMTPIFVEAEDGDIGSEFETIEEDDVTFIRITTDTNETTGATGYPGEDRTASYTVVFPEGGPYALYARVRVGPDNADDDSFFYGRSTFGEKDPADPEDWTMVNGLHQAGFADADEWVVERGVAASGVWKWVNITNNPMEGASDTLVVSADELTTTFQIGGREDGLDIDKFAFAPLNLFFTVAMLDNGDPGVVEIPEDPTPDPTGPPLAHGLDKWLGNIYSAPQIQHFEAYWNQVTPENAGKWGSVEGTRGVYNWTELDAAYKLAKDNGFPFRFHILTWGGQQPNWINDLSTEEQLEAITAWYDAVAERYPDMEYVEVVNEGSNGHQLPDGESGDANYIEALGGTNGVYDTGFDWIITAFEMARERFPDSKLMINDYNIVSSNTWSTPNARNYKRIIDELNERGLIDVIGVQAHAFSTVGTPAQMRAVLDLLGSTGLPIQATEMDIQGDSNLSDAESDQVQLRNMQRIFPTFWEHPSVEGITLWGWRPGLWMEDAELVRANGEERPALEWLREYLDHQRSVSNEQVKPEAQFRLVGNYPNPLSESTQIRYEIAEPVNVNLTVYDILGRTVETLVSAHQTPGEYTVSLDASRLASGVYLYRIQAGSFVETKQMVVVR